MNQSLLTWAVNCVGPASCPPVWVGQRVSHYRVYQHHLVLSCSVIPDSLQPHGLYPSVRGDSPGKNAGVGYHALLQGIFPTQRTNLGLPHRRQIHFCLSPQGSPRIPEWIAYTSFRATYRHRNWTALQADSSSAEPPGKPKNHLEGLLNHKSLGVTPRISNSVGQGTPVTSNKFLDDTDAAGPRNTLFELRY